jgi:hypothetical protein
MHGSAMSGGYPLERWQMTLGERTGFVQGQEPCRICDALAALAWGSGFIDSGQHGLCRTALTVAL